MSACRCPMTMAGMIEHRRDCRIVWERHMVLSLSARPKASSLCVFNPLRRRARTVKRRGSGGQLAA